MCTKVDAASREDVEALLRKNELEHEILIQALHEWECTPPRQTSALAIDVSQVWRDKHDVDWRVVGLLRKHVNPVTMIQIEGAGGVLVITPISEFVADCQFAGWSIQAPSGKTLFLSKEAI